MATPRFATSGPLRSDPPGYTLLVRPDRRITVPKRRYIQTYDCLPEIKYYLCNVPGTFFATDLPGVYFENRMILTVLFFIIAGFYLAGLLGRLLLGYWIRKKQKEFGGGGFTRTYTWGGRREASGRKPEGDVTVSRTQASPEKKINRNVGDYVDYEEIKEP